MLNVCEIRLTAARQLAHKLRRVDAPEKESLESAHKSFRSNLAENREQPKSQQRAPRAEL